MHSLEIDNVSKRLDDWEVLRGISFTCYSTEAVGIIGPSGCGKSTLLHLIAGHLAPDTGEVRLSGERITGHDHRLTLMPQQDLLLDHLTIIDNCALPIRLSGRNKQAARSGAQPYFETFGLSGFERAYPNQLSGGMRQRAAMLRTMLSKAEALLLDEPFGALDAITRAQMQEFLLGQRDKLSQMCLLVTHDVEEALYLSDRIIVLSGRPASVNLELRVTKEPGREWLLGQECAHMKKTLFEALAV